ncbi:MAG: hypothetical protein AAFW83_09040 [Pseudomonadota bacterium]
MSGFFDFAGTVIDRICRTLFGVSPEPKSVRETSYQRRNIIASQYSILPDAPKISGRPPCWIGLKHGKYLYEFQVLKTEGEIRIYILAAPSYGKHKITAHLTHRWFDDVCRIHYVCCGGRSPTDFDDAKEFARLWCRYTTHYVETGQDLFAS